MGMFTKEEIEESSRNLTSLLYEYKHLKHSPSVEKECLITGEMIDIMLHNPHRNYKDECIMKEVRIKAESLVQ